MRLAMRTANVWPGSHGDLRPPLDPADARFELKADQSRTIAVIAGADCAVTELDVPDGAEVSYRDSDGDGDGRVQVERSARVQVTNRFDAEDVAGRGGAAHRGRACAGGHPA